MTPSRLRSASEQGFGLIEMMVSLVIGMILTAGIMRIFISSKRLYRVDANLSQMLDSGRFASHYLSREVREAGNIGCADLASVTPVTDIAGSPSLLLATNAVGGIDNVAAGNGYGATVGTDVLWLRKGSSPYRRLTAAMANASGGIPIVSGGARLGSGQIVLISDCNSGDIFYVSDVAIGGGGTTLLHRPGVNTSGSLSKAYGVDATVMAFDSLAYFVRPNASGVPALWSQNLSGTRTELVDGVENLQVRYGEDTDGDGVANQYATAGAVSDWSQVVTVRLNLLLVSDDDDLTTTPQPYTLDGVTVTPTDHRLRRVFTSTVALRGRTL